MVAYSFHKRFADDVAEGRKTQTIRAHRKRHARIGEPVQLYTGMRTRQCRKLRGTDPTCSSALPIEISIPAIGDDAQVRVFPAERWEQVGAKFAIADGFADVAEFVDFWRRTHGEGFFDGVLIKWVL